VTPEGCVYVTETLAAVLAIHNAAEFTRPMSVISGRADAAQLHPGPEFL
jgi:hypothetical protein